MSTLPRSQPRLRRVSRTLRRWWRTLLHEKADPKSLGLAVGLGVVVGCSPFFGFQTLLAIGLASLFRLNRIAVVLGAQISTPPITAVIVFAGAQLGELILHQRWLPLKVSDIRAVPPGQLVKTFLVDLGVGGLVLGAALGLVLGTATAVVIRRRRARPRPPGLDELLLDAVEERAEGLPRRWRSYAFWKIRFDPVYALALPAFERAAEVVDLGAGMGLLSVLCALRFPGVRVKAVEWDAVKAAQARALAAGLPVEVLEADAHGVALGRPDAIALVDLLHYVPVASQRALLERCADALAPGGVLVIRDLAGKGRLAGWLDRLAVRWGWNRGAGVEAWSGEEMRALLEAKDFAVQAQAAGQGPFRGNVLLVAHKL